MLNDSVCAKIKDIESDNIGGAQHRVVAEAHARDKEAKTA
jgi:hypothetical protein